MLSNYAHMWDSWTKLRISKSRGLTSPLILGHELLVMFQLCHKIDYNADSGTSIIVAIFFLTTPIPPSSSKETKNWPPDPKGGSSKHAVYLA